MGIRSGVLLFVMVACVLPAWANGAYEIVDLGAFETWSFANDINDRSEVVGESAAAMEPWDFPRAFRWREEGGMLPLPLGLDGHATGINDRGEIAGTCTDATARQFPCLWTRKGVADLGLVGRWCWALQLNVRGHVVGRCLVGEPGSWHAFLWTPKEGMRDLGTFGEEWSSAYAINAKDEVVGAYGTGSGSAGRPFLWSERRGFVDLGTLGGEGGFANDINARGQVVGASDTASGERHAFLWSEEEGMRDLTPATGSVSLASGVNDLGQAVGAYLTENRTRAFLWSEEEGMVGLGSLVGAYSVARAINNRGEIVGSSGSDSGFGHACLWRPLPPSKQ